MRRLVVVLFLFALAVAGCFDASDRSSDEDLAAPKDLPSATGFTYACPPGETELVDDLCVGRIRVPDRWLTEPFLVIDEARPDIVVIGAIRTSEESTIQALQEASLRNPLRVSLFVSEDGGASWERREHPDLPKENGGYEYQTADPALAIDADGDLHLSVLVTTGEVYYTNTSDLGRTWSRPVHLPPFGGADRNWMTVDANGSAYVPWYTDGGAHVAYSDSKTDGWTSATLDGCGIASEVVVLTATPLLACTHLENDAPVGVNIAELDPRDAALTVRAEVPAPGADWSFLLAGPDDTLHLVAQDRDQTRIFYATSSDEGYTWTKTTELRETLQIEDDWPRVRPYWATIDPWGSLHMILSEDGPAVENEAAFIYVKPAAGPTKLPVAHAVLEPETGEVLAERMLLEPSAPTSPDPMGAPVALFDHYYGLDFALGGGIMVWADEGSLRYTALEPHLGP